MVSGVQRSAADDAGLATTDRQLTQLINGPDVAQELHLTCLVQQLASSSSSSSSSNNANRLHSLTVLIQSLLQPQKDVRKGLQLIEEVIRTAPWDAYAASCHTWVQAALTHFERATIEAVHVLDTLLGSQARQRTEYWRDVGSEATKKYALLLVSSLEDKSTPSNVIRHVLQALSVQIELRPSEYRVHAPKLENACKHLLFVRRMCREQAATLLARLPLTGNGRERQAVLWSTTFDLLLREAEMAWQACSSTFIEYGTERQTGHNDTPAPTTSVFASSDETDEDELAALRTAHEHLSVLLGSAPQAGVIAIFLSESTSFVVKLRWTALLSLLHSIIDLLPSSPTQLGIIPEAALHAAQAALLPKAHLCAISLLVALPHEVWHAKHAHTVIRLTRLALKGSSSIRCVALQALAVLQLPLDPHGEALERVSRACLAQLSRLVNQDVPPLANATKSNSNESRASKKRKVTYESDQVIMRPLRGFVELDDDDEYAACIAATQVLANVYGYLVTFVKPQLHDLAQTSALLMLGLVEIALKQPDELTAQLVRTLARLISMSRGPLLGLLTVRSATLCAQALASLDDETRTAADVLQMALCDTFNPKLPPKMALRMHIEEHDRLDVDAQDELQLDDVALDEERGASERRAMLDVLDIGASTAAAVSAINTTTTLFGRAAPSQSLAKDTPTSSAFTSPTVPASSSTTNIASAITTAGAYSPDPVKPIRRPSTPRIGSPGAAAMGPAVATGLSAASTYDGTLSASAAPPLRPSASSQVSSALPLASSIISTDVTAQMRSRPLVTPSSPLGKPHEKASDDRLVSSEKLDDGEDDDDGDDDDESLPEIDMRSSDEESDAAGTDQ